MKKSIIGFLICLTLGFSTTKVYGQLAKGADKFFGCIIKNVTSPDPDFNTYFNQVTPENAGKWGKVEAVRDVMDWSLLDFSYNYAKNNGMPFKQHTFIWDLQQPAWMTSLSLAEQKEEVEEWIAAYCSRYPDIDLIEPLNEPTRNAPPYKEALGGNGTTGYDWIIWAFEKARQYAPGAKLILNDYDVLKNSTVRNQIIAIADTLKIRNLIDAIGCQGHFLEYESASGIKTALDQLAATGLDIYITELDIHLANDQSQLNQYKKIFPVIWEHPAVKGVTLWGYKQGAMWRSDGYLLRNNGTERPAMTWLKEYIPSTTPLPYTFISSPDQTTFYREGQNIQVMAEATDARGTITQVEFFSNNTSLGVVTEPPYQISIESIPHGITQFTAVATNDQALTFESAIHTITALKVDTGLPWLEEFNLPNATTSNQGSTSWQTIARSPGVFSVQNNRFVTNDVDFECQWSCLVDISNEENVWFSIDVQAGGELDINEDYMRVYYKVDDNDLVEVFYGQALFNKGNRQTVVSAVPQGQVLQIIIESFNTNSNEFYYWDNVRISSGYTSLSVESVDDSFCCKFTCYPNPVKNGILHIQSQEPLSTIRVFSLLGDINLTQNAEGSQRVEFDVSMIRAGVYILTIETKTGLTHSKRLIKL